MVGRVSLPSGTRFNLRYPSWIQFTLPILLEHTCIYKIIYDCYHKLYIYIYIFYIPIVYSKKTMIQIHHNLPSHNKCEAKNPHVVLLSPRGKSPRRRGLQQNLIDIGLWRMTPGTVAVGSLPLTTRNTTRNETKIGAFIRRPYFWGRGGMRYVALLYGKPFRKKKWFFLID